MNKPLQIEKKKFFGGISDDPRKISDSEFQISKHFDIFSQPNRLVPYRSLETDTNDGSSATGMKQYLLRDFVYASASAKEYALGQNASGKTKIVYKADAATGNYTLPASSEGDGAVQNGCLFEYKDKLWGFQGTTQIFSYGLLSGVPAITNSAGTTAASISSVANGVIAADGNAYLAYNNVVVRISTALAITDSAKTVPTNYKITSLTNYGNYLAIAAAPVSTFNGASKVFLWNLSSDLFQESIDWGEGEIRVLETIEGMLVGITDRYLNNSTGAGRGSLIVQTYEGGSAQVRKEVFTQALSGKTMPISKAVKNNRLFFAAKIMTNTAGTTYNEGIWSFGRKNATYPFTLTLDVIDENINTSGIQAFGTAGNFFFIAHSGDGSVDKTDDTAAYTFTSIYESQIEDFGDPTKTKQLNQVTVFVAPILSGGSVTVKYKNDADTSFTTIGTLSTVGALSRDFYNIESTTSEFASHKEITIRLESTGGAEITGYKIIATPLLGSN